MDISFTEPISGHERLQKGSYESKVSKNIEEKKSYLLRFRLYTDASDDVKYRYKKVYEEIVATDTNRRKSGKWSLCRKHIEKYLNPWIWKLNEYGVGNPSDRQLLNRDEGGIGGDCNRTERQIRFYNDQEVLLCGGKFGEITLIALPSDDGTSFWVPDELKQFGEAFSEMLNDQIKTSGAIDFYIALFDV